MTSKRAKIVLGVTVTAALCWLSAPYWGSADKESLPVSTTSLRFNAEQAFETTQEFVTRNPRRVLGSIEARQAAGHIQERLERLGYEVDTPSYFDAIIAGRRQAGRNVIAFKSGALPEILAVITHYDTARTTFQGAMDDGAGVGVLLELARVFAGSPLRHSLLIVASDGEEWGMLGAADIAANYPERQHIAAVLSLDGVSIGDLSALRLDADGQRSGYAPRWLRRIAFRAAEVQGLPLVASSGFQEDIQRAIALSLTDQGPFLNAGIPAINLGSSSVDEARERDVYHSQNDTIANIKPASIGKYGEAAERILRSIDELTAIPRGKSDDVRWSNDTFVSGWAMAILQYLAFLPFLVIAGFGWSDCRQSLSGEKIGREAVFFLAWLAPFALIYSLILFCRLMRWLPRSSLYPGPLKDPILENPAWGVVAGILGAAAVVAIGLHFLARYLTRGQSRAFRASRMTLLMFLLILVVLASLYNSYWAVTFLTLPALIWGAVGRGRSLAARAGGALAILAAGFVFYAVALLYAHSLNAGWNIVWYATLGLSNGMLPWQEFFLAASAVVIGLRFLALQITSFPE